MGAWVLRQRDQARPVDAARSASYLPQRARVGAVTNTAANVGGAAGGAVNSAAGAGGSIAGTSKGASAG